MREGIGSWKYLIDRGRLDAGYSEGMSNVLGELNVKEEGFRGAGRNWEGSNKGSNVENEAFRGAEC